MGYFPRYGNQQAYKITVSAIMRLPYLPVFLICSRAVYYGFLIDVTKINYEDKILIKNSIPGLLKVPEFLFNRIVNK